MKRKKLIWSTAAMALIMVILSLTLMMMDPDHWFIGWVFCALGVGWLVSFTYANWDALMRWVSKGQKED